MKKERCGVRMKKERCGEKREERRKWFKLALKG